MKELIKKWRHLVRRGALFSRFINLWQRTFVVLLHAQVEVRRAMIGIAKARADLQSARVDLYYLAGQNVGEK